MFASSAFKKELEKHKKSVRFLMHVYDYCIENNQEGTAIEINEDFTIDEVIDCIEILHKINAHANVLLKLREGSKKLAIEFFKVPQRTDKDYADMSLIFVKMMDILKIH